MGFYSSLKHLSPEERKRAHEEHLALKKRLDAAAAPPKPARAKRKPPVRRASKVTVSFLDTPDDDL